MEDTSITIVFRPWNVEDLFQQLADLKNAKLRPLPHFKNVFEVSRSN